MIGILWTGMYVDNYLGRGTMSRAQMSDDSFVVALSWREYNDVSESWKQGRAWSMKL
jgi:hypothetical protein